MPLALLRKYKKRGNWGAWATALVLFAGTAQAQIAPDGLQPRAPLYVTPMISGILL